MLSEIRIQDLGVIEETILDLGPGLTVLTGETGAGKTMVVTALGLLLGQRADSGLVRSGAAKASVEGVVTVAGDHPAQLRAVEAGADVSGADPDLVLVRTISQEGRSRAHVGGRSAPIGVLAEIGEHLVAVHGQADQWRLRQPDQHRELLDRFGWPTIEGPLTAYKSAYAAHRAAAAELRELTEQARERAQEAHSLTAALDQIEAIAPQPGEDVALAEEAERLGHLEELRAAASESATLLAGDDEMSGGSDPGALGALARVRHLLERASQDDVSAKPLAARATELAHIATELTSDVVHYLADLDVDPARLEWVQHRRAALVEISRLYGPRVDDVIAWSQDASSRLGTLVGDEDRVLELHAEVSRRAQELGACQVALTRARVDTAGSLTAAIMQELSSLAMPGARLEVAVRERDPGPDGADDVEIGLAANTGGEIRPVTKAASGGELSRIMLAIEVATAEGSQGPPTFVFDEVDAGIGGRAALAVGARLAALARHAQVIVVTHLAQVAAHADHHLVVHKSDDGSITRSGVRTVDGEARVLELARMLGGTDSDAALEHARDLLGQVRARLL